MTRWMIGVLLLGAIGCDAAQVESAARSLGASLAV
jgi:hypothetical protein